MERSADLEPSVEAPGQARQLVAQLLDDQACPQETVEVARLLASELVSNVVRHARGELRLRAVVDGPSLRVEVLDHAPGRPQVVRAEPDELGGRGLALVDALADEWGITAVVADSEAPIGKVVWFELRWSSTA